MGYVSLLQNVGTSGYRDDYWVFLVDDPILAGELISDGPVGVEALGELLLA